MVEVYVLPREIQEAVANFPEVRSLAIPGLVWGISAISCWQIIALMTLRLIFLTRARDFRESAYKWVLAIVGVLLFYVALVVVATVVLLSMGYSTPALLVPVCFGTLAFIAAIALIVSPATNHARIVGRSSSSSSSPKV
ncbi:hypothetical protein [Arthrobacter sp. Soil782]|uniref:hypothetical protein n=1 Tax=Arthrobacter sp. Soil782 TaxID=1736410 RepID=UPI0012F8AE57|nr:hypothetical protein [Arthrobacter sp. Soil782]